MLTWQLNFHDVYGAICNIGKCGGISKIIISEILENPEEPGRAQIPLPLTLF